VDGIRNSALDALRQNLLEFLWDDRFARSVRAALAALVLGLTVAKGGITLGGVVRSWALEVGGAVFRSFDVGLHGESLMDSTVRVVWDDL